MPDPTGDLNKLLTQTAGGIAELNKQMDAFKARNADLGSSSGPAAGMAKFNRELAATGETHKHIIPTITGLTDRFKDLAKVLAGPAGIAYGFYQVGRALGEFAESRVRLQNLSTDVGFTTEKIDLMERTMRRMGRTTEEAKQIYSAFGLATKEMAALREGSPLFQIFRDAGEAAFGEKLIAGAKDVGKTWDEVLKHIKAGSDEYQDYMAAKLGIPRSVIDSYGEFEKTTQKGFEASYQHSQKYLDGLLKIETTLGNMIARAEEFAVAQIANRPENIEMQKRWAIDPNFRRRMFPEDIAKTGPRYGDVGGGDYGPTGVSGATPSATFGERFGVWDKHRDEVAEDSNKSLKDIRDSLLRMEEGEGRGGGGGGGGGGDGGGPGGIYSRGGVGRARRARGGGGAGSGGESEEGSTMPPSGNLAAQRAGFQKELENDPQLKNYAIDAMKHEGGIQSNMEQLFNYAAMRHMTIRQALHSGQYGPVMHGLISGNISERTRQAGEAALQKVYAGSNITDYATDQGMAGDPNFAKYMSNPAYWHMHQVQGAWFSAHGEAGRRYYAEQKARDARARAEAGDDTRKEVQHPPSEVQHPPSEVQHPSEVPDKSFQERWNERISPKELTGKIRPQSFVGNMAEQTSMDISRKGGEDYYEGGGGYQMKRGEASGMQPFPGFRQSGNVQDRRDEQPFEAFFGGHRRPPMFRGYHTIHPLSKMGAELGGGALDEELTRHGRPPGGDYSKVGPDGFVSSGDRDRFDKTQSNGGGSAAVNHNLDVDVDFKNIPSWVKTGIAGGKFNRLKVTRSTAGGARSEEPVGSTDSNRWSY